MITESTNGRADMICIWEASSAHKFNDKGFTLIEIMVTMVVVMFMALALGRLNANTWNTTDLSKSYTEASTHASQQLEALFSAKYVTDQQQEDGMNKAIWAGSHSFASSDGKYQISYTVRDNDIIMDTKAVQMNVSFTRGGVVKTVRYNYLLPIRK